MSCVQDRSDKVNSNIFSEPDRGPELTDKKLKEVSGLVMSRANPGMMWLHNDSGNAAAVYLVDMQLNIRLTCRIQGVKNRDWEDIAIGPGPDEGKHYVYIADIGDNNARYDKKFVYRFEEPVVKAGVAAVTVADFETITFELEGSRKDTEALWVHPRSGNIYLVSKREKPVHVYELNPSSNSTPQVARSVTTLPLTQIVAADISADGGEIIMKNYDNIYYWRLEGRPLHEAFADRPLVLPYTEEPQGEAIGFLPDGSGFLTLSETLKGERAYLYRYSRTTSALKER